VGAEGSLPQRPNVQSDGEAEPREAEGEPSRECLNTVHEGVILTQLWENTHY
jgi:hypothetical protein